MHCFTCGSITSDNNETLTASQLNGLASCADFLSSKDDAENNGFTINEKSLTHYFKHRIPSVDIKERELILSVATSSTLQNALTSWKDELSMKVADFKTAIIENYGSIQTADVHIDSPTASRVFIKKFNPIIVVDNFGIKIQIPNCGTGQVLSNLWEHRKEIEYILSVNSVPNNDINSDKKTNDETEHVTYEYDILNKCIIPLIIEPLEAPGLINISNIAFGSEEQRLLIKKIIKDTCDDFVNKHVSSLNVNVNFVRILECYIRMGYETGELWLQPHKVLKHYFSHLTTYEDAKHLLEFLLQKHPDYSSNYSIKETGVIKQELADGLKSWHAILHNLIFKCSNNDIINTMHAWFCALNDGGLDENYQMLLQSLPAESIGQLKYGVHSYHEVTATWIKTKLLPRFNAIEKADIGMFLANYLVSVRPHGDEFSKIYCDVMKNFAGITWDLLPQRK